MSQNKRPGNISLRLTALHLFALCGFVIAQPIYDWTARQPEFLIAHGAGTRELLLLVVLATLLIPALLSLITVLFRLFGKTVSNLVTASLIGVLTGMFALLFLSALPAFVALLLAVLAGLAGMLAYHFSRFYPMVLTVAAAPAALFPLLFLFTDPVRSLLLPGQSPLLAADSPVGSMSGTAPDVVLLMLDEWPLAALLDEAGDIDAIRFPGFARLASTSTWYPHATTPHRGTIHAVPATLTGRIPHYDRMLPDWRFHPDNLFTWAARVHGENVQVYERFTRLCPGAICPAPERLKLPSLLADTAVLYGWRLLPEETASRHLPAINETWNGFVDVSAWLEPDRIRDRTVEFREFLAAMDGGFQYKHLVLPHTLHVYLPDGSRYPDPLRPLGYNRTQNVPGHTLLDMQRFMAQARYTDRLLEELMDRLQDSGRWNDTALVVVADHGRSFRPDSHWRLIDDDNMADILGIPLFIKKPGQSEARVDHQPASLIDVAPSIADIVGQPLHWPSDGRSLMNGSDPVRRRVPVFCENNYACTPEVRERSDDEGLIHIDFHELRERLAESREWMHAHGVYVSAIDAFVPRSPFTSLLGQNEVDMAPVIESDAVIEWFEPDRLDTVRPASGNVPALVGGRLDDSLVQPGDWLLLALNGRFAGVARVAVEDGAAAPIFAALLPPALFRQGQNSLAVYRQTLDDNGEPMLIRVGALNPQ